MILTKATTLEADLAVLTDPSVGVILFSNEDACALMVRNEDATIRVDEAPAYVVWTYVSTNHPGVIQNYCELNTRGFRIDDIDYLWNAGEVNDVTPVDQSDLSDPGAIASDPPEQYPAVAVMYERWRNPESKQVQNLLDSIRRGDVEASTRDTTAADNSEENRTEGLTPL